MLNWFILSLISALGFGIIPLLLKNLGTTFPPQLVMAWYYSIIALILWIFSFITSKVSLPTIESFGLVLLVSILAAVADLSIFFAYKLTSNVGYPRAIQAFSIVIATILSALVYKQLPPSFGVIGVILVLSGVILLSGIK